MHFIYCHTCRVANPATLSTPLGEVIMAFASEKEASHMVAIFKLHSVISKDALNAANPEALRRGLPILFFKDVETIEKMFDHLESFDYSSCLIVPPG